MIDWILVALAVFIITFSISLTVQSFRGKNQIIANLKEENEELKGFREIIRKELAEERKKVIALQLQKGAENV